MEMGGFRLLATFVAVMSNELRTVAPGAALRTNMSYGLGI